jgi:hypothetical protein
MRRIPASIQPSSQPSRREFLGTTAGQIAGAAALAGLALPRVHAAGSDEIRIAVVGCGGRGGGAAVDALSVPGGETRVVALADVFSDRAKIVKRSIEEQFKERVDVPDDRIFTGFEAYKQALGKLLRERRIEFMKPGVKLVRGVKA